MTDEQKGYKELSEDEFLGMEKIDLLEKYRSVVSNWKYVAAEYENYKRTKETERKELIEFSKEITVRKLIPSLESLEQVLTYAPVDEKYKEWLTGLKATITQLEKTMEELGVIKIKTVGQPFNHELHDAVEEGDGPEGEVIKELQPGFMLNGKVIVPAKVVVGKKG